MKNGEFKKYVACWHFGALCVTGIATGVLFLPSAGMAQVDITGQSTYTMNDNGSTATVNVGNTGTLGMNGWFVGGVSQSQLNQQWFWYSINGSAPQPINAISAATVYSVNGNPLGSLNDLGVVYNNDQLTASLEYILSGNGAATPSADLMEYISLVNNGSSPINLSFYQYSNFNLLQNNNNTVNISGGPGNYAGATQTTGGPGGTGIGEVILGPNANRAEAAQVPQTFNELSGLNYLNLNDSTTATGDVSWAFQWNVTLDVGQEFDLTKDKGLQVTVVPEPGTTALAVLGGLCLTGWTVRRRHSAS
ncbi:MAG: PEP-CTERM sorting domain-containing protein [Limisphaerales bacterium]